MFQWIVEANLVVAALAAARARAAMPQSLRLRPTPKAQNRQTRIIELSDVAKDERFRK